MRKLVILATLLCLFIPVWAQAFDVTLAWDASPSTDIKDYVVYYDTNSGTPKSNSVAVGNVLQATITNLPDGIMHYFHVTAQDWEGRESGPSNEVGTDGIISPDTGEDPIAPGGCYVVTVTPSS